MFKNITYKYIGLVIASIIVGYVCIKTIKFQYKLIEGLQNTTLVDVTANAANASVKTKNDKLDDSIALDKYRADYENLIISTEEYAKNALLLKIVSIATSIGKLDSNTTMTDNLMNDIDAANKLHKFNDTLVATMDFIDAKKTNSYF